MIHLYSYRIEGVDRDNDLFVITGEVCSEFHQVWTAANHDAVGKLLDSDQFQCPFTIASVTIINMDGK
jgi:hypothetical protein